MAGHLTHPAELPKNVEQPIHDDVRRNRGRRNPAAFFQLMF